MMYVRRALSALVLLCLHGAVSQALAFPPYRSTDADTADPYAVELRAGVQWESEDGASETLFPSLRLNFGLPGKMEIATEFDHTTDGGGFDDGAAGLKWIPFVSEDLSVGVESLMLLPIREGDAGTGTETQLVATFDRKAWRIHLNAGGGYDARGMLNEKGWRASSLLEIPVGKSLIGFELFAKDTNRQSVDARVGAGMIYDAGPFDLRLGVHAGLTRSAPDAAVNFWIARAFSFQ